MYTGIEWTDPSKTAFVTMAIAVFIAFGSMVLSGVAYLITHWRVQQLVLLSPLALYVGFCYWSAAHHIRTHSQSFKV